MLDYVWKLLKKIFNCSPGARLWMRAMSSSPFIAFHWPENGPLVVASW